MYSPRQRTPGHRENTWGHTVRCPRGGLGEGHTFQFDRKKDKTIMVRRKGIIHRSYANALYPAQAIQWNKCNLTRFSTNLKFEDFFWMVPQATENAVAGHMQCADLQLGHTGLNQTTLMQSYLYTLRGLLCKQSCGNIHKVQFWLLSEQVQSCNCCGEFS